MSSQAFAFVNTFGAASLSKQNAKRARGLVTKRNFADRRRRIAAASESTEEATDTASSDAPLTPPEASELAGKDFSSSIDVAKPTTYAKLLPKYVALSFLEARYSPSTIAEAAWFDLISSEPALIEASMAIAVRYWSPNTVCERTAEIHHGRAVAHIIERINSAQAQPDGILGAVLTMAFGARLAQNDEAWNLHLDGMVQIIHDRCSHGIYALPLWFTDLIILDSVNSILSFERVYHQDIVNALGNRTSVSLIKIAEMVPRIMDFRRTVDSHSEAPLGPRDVEREIETPLDLLYRDLQTMRSSDNNPVLQSSTRAMQIILLLSWPQRLTKRSQKARLADLADDIKSDICRLEVTPCIYMDLTSCTIMMGAIGAKKGSETRSWFMTKLRRVFQAMRQRGWKQPLNLLDKLLLDSESVLTKHLRALWEEIEKECEDD